MNLSGPQAKEILTLIAEERSWVDTDRDNTNMESLSNSLPTNISVEKLVSNAIIKLKYPSLGWFCGYFENRTCTTIQNYLKEIVSRSATLETQNKRTLQQKYANFTLDLAMLPSTKPERRKYVLSRAKEMFEKAHKYGLKLDIGRFKYVDNTYKEVIIKLHNGDTEGAIKILLESGDHNKIDSIILLGLANTSEQKELVRRAYQTVLDNKNLKNG